MCMRGSRVRQPRVRSRLVYEQRHRLHQRQPRQIPRGAEGAARDPEHQRAARARRRRQALRRVVRRRDAPHRHAERPAHRDAGQSGRLRRLARRAGRADDPLLRPLRRAAGRSAQPVAVAAVRGDDPRRRDLRARLGRRQGPGLHALQGDRGAPEAERQAAGQHQVSSSRARKKSAARTSTTSSSRTRTTLKRRRRRDLRLADVRPRRAVDLLRPARPGLLPDRPARQQHRSAFRIVRRRRRQPGVRARADDRADEGPRRPHQDPRLLRRCGGADGGGARGVGEAAVQREAVPEGLRHPEAVRRDRLHDARAHVGAADARGERPAVRFHRRRREDRAAGRGDGEDQHAARAESGSGQDRRCCSRPTCARPRRRPWSSSSRACTAASRG